MMVYSDKTKSEFNDIIKASDSILLNLNNKNQSDLVTEFINKSKKFIYKNFPFLSLDNSYNVEVHMEKENTVFGGSFTNEKNYLRGSNSSSSVINCTLGTPGKEQGNITLYLGDEKKDIKDLNNKEQRTRFGFNLFFTILHEIVHAKIDELNKGQKSPYGLGYDESYMINEAFVYFTSYLIAKKITSDPDLLKTSGPANKLPDLSKIIKYEDFKKELAFSYRKVSVLSTQDSVDNLIFGEELDDIIKTEKLVSNIYEKFNGGIGDFLNVINGIRSLEQLFDLSDKYLKNQKPAI